MRQYLAEGAKGAFPFVVDRSKAFVAESRPDGKNIWRIPGLFSECDKVNGNGRRYGRKVWEKNLQPGSTLQTLIEKNAAFGLIEHPADGKVTLKSDISHAVTSAKLNEDGTVTGEITIIDMGEHSDGHKLKCLIEFGYNPLVSSRGFGTLVKASDGIDEVQDDYVCEGWDVVAQPSFERAQLVPDRSAIDTVLGKSKTESIKENTTPPAAATTPPPATPATAIEADPEVSKRLKAENKVIITAEAFEAMQNTLKQEVSKPGSLAASPVAAVPTNTQKITVESMINIQEVKARITSFKGSKPSDARSYAEGVAQLANLHQQVAEYVAEDAKRNYEGTKLHQEIESIEKAWADNQAAPAKTAARLREDRNKVLHVCKNLVETALKYKSALAEAFKSQAATQAVIEELTTNGTGWMELAGKRKAQRDFIAKKYQVACEALMLMSNRYKEDMTIVGRHALNLEFKEALSAKPDLQKSLTEAKSPQDILAIREQLEGRSETPATSSPATGSEGKNAPTVESKSAKPVAAPVTENKSKTTSFEAVVETNVRNPRNISEATEIVRRLSKASAK